jgi:hypothetical protein
MAEEEKSTEDSLGQNVKNTVEDSLRIRRDDIATLAKTPGNRVDEPKEDSPGTDHRIGSANRSFVDVVCMSSSNENDVVCNEEKCDCCKDKISPLFRSK